VRQAARRAAIKEAPKPRIEPADRARLVDALGGQEPALMELLGRPVPWSPLAVG
jgi:hypothetical protein